MYSSAATSLFFLPAAASSATRRSVSVSSVRPPARPPIRFGSDRARPRAVHPPPPLPEIRQQPGRLAQPTRRQERLDRVRRDVEETGLAPATLLQPACDRRETVRGGLHVSFRQLEEPDHPLVQ